MNAKTWLVLGASLGLLGVAAGTFGAHALPKYLDRAGVIAAEVVALREAWWETGCRYHMYHALGLLAVGWVAGQRKSLLTFVAGLAMFAGTLVFSGCLYAMALTGQTILGAVVPIGGVLFLMGWCALAAAGWGLRDDPQDRPLSAREKLIQETKPVPKELPSGDPPSSDPSNEEPASEQD